MIVLLPLHPVKHKKLKTFPSVISVPRNTSAVEREPVVVSEKIFSPHLSVRSFLVVSCLAFISFHRLSLVVVNRIAAVEVYHSTPLAAKRRWRYNMTPYRAQEGGSRQFSC